MRESQYQSRLIRRLDRMFPGCFIIKNDSGYRQGIPDLLILFGDKWAMLEVKPSQDAEQQPNQDWYVDTFNRMSFGAFIYPENERDVLHALQRAFGTRR